MKILAVLLFISFAIVGTARCSLAQALPTLIAPAELERLSADRESLDAPYPGLILTPRQPVDDLDGKYNQPYHAVCGVYAAEKASDKITSYARRFLVHAPDADSLPLAKRVARLLLLLYGANHERLRFDHARTAPTLDVWLSRQAGAGLDANIGGEQFKNQIYIYSIFTARDGAEWLREIAHEYGHYALPGVSGFTAPEEWGNGVLGEKLFLKWLHDDLRASRLRAAEIPFVNPAQFEEYIVKQVNPLLRRVARDGPDNKTLAKRDAAGMDAFCGLALTVDAVYSSRGLLDAFSYTEATDIGVFIKTADVVRGLQKALQSTLEFTITPPLPDDRAAKESFTFFLPHGEWTVTTEGPVRSWELPADAKGILTRSQTALTVSRAEWRKLTIVRTQPGATPIRLTFRRVGAEVH